MEVGSTTGGKTQILSAGYPADICRRSRLPQKKQKQKKNSDIAVYGFPLEARLNLGQYFVDFRHKISLTHSRTDLTAPEPNQILLNDGNTETRACCPVEEFNGSMYIYSQCGSQASPCCLNFFTYLHICVP